MDKRVKICVWGATDTSHCGVDALQKAKELGYEIARNKIILCMGASTGFPLWVAMGVKEFDGMVIGFSPAANEKEHTEVYKLPTDHMDVIIYTGFGYAGRDLLLNRSADAVICGCGNIKTINEFTLAFDDQKPIGIFEGDWDTGRQLREIAENHNNHEVINKKIVSGEDPKKLLQSILSLIKKR